MKPRLLALLLLLLPAIAAAQPPDPAGQLPQNPGQACRIAVQAAERTSRLPPQLLTAISLVESGRVDPASGRVVAWPWTINAGGIGFFYDTKAQAVAAARAMHAAGVASIDVGCVQISLLFHPDAFASLEQAFDPAANAAFGAVFLAGLYHQFGTWPAATAAYHSQTPELGAPYAELVMARWPLAAKFPAPLPAPTKVADRKPADHAPDDSVYTPQFRARLQQQRHEEALLRARYAAQVAAPKPAAPVPAIRLHPATAALWLAGTTPHPRPDELSSR
jgi:hypothetical protein